LLAKQLGIGNATVARAWRKYCVKRWRWETFQLSTDPELEAKVRDVNDYHDHQIPDERPAVQPCRQHRNAPARP
jgi:hypothetical protein